MYKSIAIVLAAIVVSLSAVACGTEAVTTDPVKPAAWSAQSSGSSAALTNVAFPNATHGWAVGDGGTILATANGGSTWSAQSSGSSASLIAVAESDATHGWAVGYDDSKTGAGVILSTTNGGAPR